jgi:hypothetical protein
MSGTHALAGSMQDGRFFTNYAPNCVTNSILAKALDVPTWNSSQYRAHLQAHGLEQLKIAQGGPCGHVHCSENGKAITDNSTEPSPPYADDEQMNFEMPTSLTE